MGIPGRLLVPGAPGSEPSEILGPRPVVLHDGSARAHRGWLAPAQGLPSVAPLWWTLHGEAPAGAVELRIDDAVRGRMSGDAGDVGDLRTESSAGSVSARGASVSIEVRRSGSPVEVVWPRGMAVRIDLLVRLEDEEFLLSRAEREVAIESMSPFRATLALDVRSSLGVELRLCAFRDGVVELEVLAGADALGERRVERAELLLTVEPATRWIAFGGDSLRARPLRDAPVVLESRGGDRLLVRTSRAGGDRYEEIPARPGGFVVGDGERWLCADVERFERREPMEVSADEGGRVGVAILAVPRVVGAGHRLAARLRLAHAPGPVPSSAAPTLRDLAVAKVGWLEPGTYRRAEVLGLLEIEERLEAPISEASLRSSWRRWRDASRGDFGTGWRDDGDPPLSRGVPSNLEYGAVRAALRGSLDRFDEGLEAARAAALHWRAADRAPRGSGEIPWMHARDHAATGREDGHVWLEGLLDLSFLTDDVALRRDVLLAGDALARRSRSPDGTLERTLAWPLISLCALEEAVPGRGYGAAADRFSHAILAAESDVPGLVAVRSRRGAGADEITWSPWLGGGLLGEALAEHHRVRGSAASRDALLAIADLLLERAWVDRRKAFARRLVGREEEQGLVLRSDGVLRGARNALVISTLLRAHRVRPDPRVPAVVRELLRSREARCFDLDPERAQWWTLTFRALGGVVFPGVR